MLRGRRREPIHQDELLSGLTLPSHTPLTAAFCMWHRRKLDIFAVDILFCVTRSEKRMSRECIWSGLFLSWGEEEVCQCE